MKFPSHTDFYKNIHKIEKPLLEAIFHAMGWEFETEESFWNRGKKTEFVVELEVGGWDVVYWIKQTPEDFFYENRRDNQFPPVLIEYKSSSNEWGKQFDSYIRQMKKRLQKWHHGIPILISFDPEIEDFVEAGKRSGFIVLPLSEQFWEEVK